MKEVVCSWERKIFVLASSHNKCRTSSRSFAYPIGHYSLPSFPPFFFTLSSAQEMEILFCLPVWWKSYEKRWDFYRAVKTSVWGLSSTGWGPSFLPKTLSCPWERSEGCSEQCQWWWPLAFSHGLHTGRSGLHQCMAHSIVLPCIFGSQCVHPLPCSSGLKVFGFILKDLWFLPFSTGTSLHTHES